GCARGGARPTRTWTPTQRFDRPDCGRSLRAAGPAPLIADSGARRARGGERPAHARESPGRQPRSGDRVRTPTGFLGWRRRDGRGGDPLVPWPACGGGEQCTGDDKDEPVDRDADDLETVAQIGPVDGGEDGQRG